MSMDYSKPREVIDMLSKHLGPKTGGWLAKAVAFSAAVAFIAACGGKIWAVWLAIHPARAPPAAEISRPFARLSDKNQLNGSPPSGVSSAPRIVTALRPSEPPQPREKTIPSNRPITSLPAPDPPVLNVEINRTYSEGAEAVHSCGSHGSIPSIRIDQSFFVNMPPCSAIVSNCPNGKGVISIEPLPESSTPAQDALPPAPGPNP